ncbi:3'-5' exonuclease [Radiobacillus kanasensis]|uniref:3'-5' exonuclease n=1 Tax=Radiobacillus kanasensis TaxID=2844358 RepID=UPI001E5586D0|nr:3'-5' exonuclease [Radiobacillus kanasensis]UFU00789.1 3'-5' exonuclease [Radiobacillus kanasensis]
MNIVSIDFETANKYRSSPCAIGIVVSDGVKIIDEFYSLINPLMEFDPYNIYVHGIEEVEVVDAPTFDELWPVIQKYIENGIVVAHNASFDMSVLRASLDRYQLPYPTMEYLCSVVLSKQIWPGLENYKLNQLADVHSIRFNHHNALEDARVVVQLLQAAIAEHDVRTISELIDLHGVSCGRIFERSYVTPKVKKRKQSKRRGSVGRP